MIGLEAAFLSAEEETWSRSVEKGRILKPFLPCAPSGASPAAMGSSGVALVENDASPTRLLALPCRGEGDCSPECCSSECSEPCLAPFWGGAEGSLPLGALWCFCCLEEEEEEEVDDVEVEEEEDDDDGEEEEDVKSWEDFNFDFDFDFDLDFALEDLDES